MNNEQTSFSSAIKEGFKQGTREALKNIGIGDETRRGRVKRWFFVPQVVIGLAAIPLIVYNFIGTSELSHRAKVELVMDKGAVLNKISGDMVRLEILDGPHAGQKVAFRAEVGKTYTPGQELVVVYRDRRLMGPHVTSTIKR